MQKHRKAIPVAEDPPTTSYQAFLSSRLTPLANKMASGRQLQAKMNICGLRLHHLERQTNESSSYLERAAAAAAPAALLRRLPRARTRRLNLTTAAGAATSLVLRTLMDRGREARVVSL